MTGQENSERTSTRKGVRDKLRYSFWIKDGDAHPLEVTQFQVSEQISALTDIEVTLSCRSDAFDANLLLDMEATLSVHHHSHSHLRHFSGVIREIETTIGDRGRPAYRVRISPEAYRLSVRSDCRIYQAQTVPEIAQSIFKDWGIRNVVWSTSAQYRAREYCVCYNETLWSFVDRIFAEEGIYYYFLSEPGGKCTMIIEDFAHAAEICADQRHLPFNDRAAPVTGALHCSSFRYVERIAATALVQRDYTFKAPKANMELHQHSAQLNGVKQDYRTYDYPGGYKQEDAGRTITQNKLDAMRVDASLAYGVANSPFLVSGRAFSLCEHPTEHWNRKWRLLKTEFVGSQPQALEERAPSSDETIMFRCDFVAQSAHLPYRPGPQCRPLINGPQIATVTGPQDEEIYCDKYGRIKVSFPWDRYSHEDDTSSCWIRVTQGWGGSLYGNMALPRVGHEVVVEFLDGNPDQPIITGRTFHSTNLPPYELPVNKTKTVIRTNTHKGKGFNELLFEDESGKENFFIRAQRDHTGLVGRNRTVLIDSHDITSVGGNAVTDVGGSTTTTTRDSAITIIGGISVAIMGMVENVVTLQKETGTLLLDAMKKGRAMNQVETTKMAGFIAAPVFGFAKTAFDFAKIYAKNGPVPDSTQAANMSAVSDELSKIKDLIPAATGTMANYVRFLTEKVEVAKSEQVGESKVSNVGNAYIQKIGKYKKTTVGEEYEIEVGKAKLILKSDGTVELQGTEFKFSASGGVQINGATIDLNKPGAATGTDTADT
jgi:type VI secretion system secreted protein VgrG